MAKPFRFLDLPLELREQIYSLYFKPADRITFPESTTYDDAFGGGVYKFDLDIYSVSKQVKAEAEEVWRRENIFICIETPWPQAAHHVAHEGLLPIVATSRAANLFKHAHATVQISAPLHEFNAAYKVIILLDDLHLFCQVWYYSALNYRQLNEHLRVEYGLRDPYYPADPKPIPIELQKRLLLPFGAVKNCYEVEVVGYDSSVEEELRRTMTIPYDSVQKCLEDCAALMQEGDRELSTGGTQSAIEKYIEAFKAIHILTDGRSRRVLADSFFHDGIESGQFAGQIGTTVRVVLRVQLVARVVAAYLNLKEWEEAAFWGMRSIRIMREAMDTEFEDFLTDFVAASDVGLLYTRTGIAFRKMEDAESEELKVYENEQDVANSEQLLQSAKRYLKERHGPLLKKELEAHGVKLFEWSFKFSNTEEESDVDSLAPMYQDFADTLSVDEGDLHRGDGAAYEAHA